MDFWSFTHCYRFRKAPIYILFSNYHHVQICHLLPTISTYGVAKSHGRIGACHQQGLTPLQWKSLQLQLTCPNIPSKVASVQSWAQLTLPWVIEFCTNHLQAPQKTWGETLPKKFWVGGNSWKSLQTQSLRTWCFSTQKRCRYDTDESNQPCWHEPKPMSRSIRSLAASVPASLQPD